MKIQNLNMLRSGIILSPFQKKNCLIPTFRSNEEKRNDYKEFSTLLSEYNKVLVAPINDDRPLLNIDNLPDKSIEEEFEEEELKLLKGFISLSDIMSLTYSYIVDEIRHLEETGELLPYVEQQYRDECIQNRFTKEETEQFINDKKRKFEDEIQIKRQKAIDEINTTAPSIKPHTVYRVIKQSSTPESKQYIERIKNLKEGDKIELNTTPIYVSSSAKKVMKNYGGGCMKDTVLFKINLPVGSKLLKLPCGDKIEQCIMKPKSKFIVASNQMFQNGPYLITLNYVLDNHEVEGLENLKHIKS